MNTKNAIETILDEVFANANEEDVVKLGSRNFTVEEDDCEVEFSPEEVFDTIRQWAGSKIIWNPINGIFNDDGELSGDFDYSLPYVALLIDKTL